MTSENTIAETEIRKLVDDRVTAVRTKDVALATSHLAPGIVAFDVINPLRYTGSDALRERVQQWFSSFNGPIGFEVSDLSIVTDGDVAFSHSLNRVTATMMDGKALEMWWRSTVCYRRIEGRWMVAHEHNSVPFDPQTGKASLDLRP